MTVAMVVTSTVVAMAMRPMASTPMGMASTAPTATTMSMAMGMAEGKDTNHVDQ